MNKQTTGRQARSVNRTPVNGQYTINVKMILSEDLYNELMQIADKEKRSLSSMAVMQLERFVEQRKKLGL